MQIFVKYVPVNVADQKFLIIPEKQVQRLIKANIFYTGEDYPE